MKSIFKLRKADVQRIMEKSTERKSESMRVKVILECSECHSRNYVLTKNKQTNPERMEVKKFCPKENKMTLHKETK